MAFFREKLRRALEEKGWSVAELARRTAGVVSQPSISAYLEGLREPGAHNLIALAQALDRPVGWFYGDEPPGERGRKAEEVGGTRLPQEPSVPKRRGRQKKTTAALGPGEPRDHLAAPPSSSVEAAHTALGPRLHQALAESGISREDLAAKIGVSDTTVWRWIRGDVPPKAKNLTVLAQTLNKPLEFFFSGEESEPFELLMKEDGPGGIRTGDMVSIRPVASPAEGEGRICLVKVGARRLVRQVQLKGAPPGQVMLAAANGPIELLPAEQVVILGVCSELRRAVE